MDGYVKDWGQTAKTVTFQILMRNISLKKIDVGIYDLLVKINIQERKEVLIIDLYEKVDITKLSHSIKLQGGKLKITLKKAVE